MDVKTVVHAASERTPLLSGVEKEEEINVVPCKYRTSHPLHCVQPRTDPSMAPRPAGYLRQTADTVEKAFADDMMVVYSFVRTPSPSAPPIVQRAPHRDQTPTRSPRPASGSGTTPPGSSPSARGACSPSRPAASPSSTSPPAPSVRVRARADAPPAARPATPRSRARCAPSTASSSSSAPRRARGCVLCYPFYPF